MLFLLTLCLALQASSGFLWFRSDYDSPEEEDLFPILEDVASNLDTIMGQLLTNLDLEEWQVDVVLDEVVSALDLAANASSGCRGCVLATAGFKTLVQSGLTFEDLRDEAIQICFNLSESENMRGDILCESAIDIFGPHLVYILNTTTLLSEDICLKMNSCEPDDIEPEEPAAKHKRGTSKHHGPKPYRRKVALEDAIKVWFITDAHIEPYYSTGAATSCGLPSCCRDEWPGTGYAIPWGDYNCNAPFRTIDAFLEMFAQAGADYLMYTGDSPSNAVWEETLVHQINMSQVVADKINTFLPGIPAYTTIGNHEMFPTNMYYNPIYETQTVVEAIGQMWQGLSGFTQEQLDTIAIGGFYSVVVKPGLRVISYNSNFGATANWYILLDQETNGYDAMKQFLEDTFDLARSNGEKVIALAHHTSGSGGRIREYSEFVTDLFRRNADLVVLHLFGHSHDDTFQMNTDLETGEVYDVQYSGPSINSRSYVNPSAKLFYLHPDTFDALEMDTFYLDLLDPSNNGSEANIQMYRATVEYGMVDVTPESFRDFVDRMEVDDELFNKYRFNSDTRTGPVGDCTGDCKVNFFCDIRTTSYTQDQECRAQS